MQRLHPDHGGDPEEFVRVLHLLDLELAALTPGAPSPARQGSTVAARQPDQAFPSGVFVVRRAGPVRRARRTLRATTVRLTRDLRGRLPRSMPGSRRYGSL